MTMQPKTLALVLSAAPYAESTLLLRLLTEDHGVVRVLAKGARRGGKRATPQATFEPLALVEAALRLKAPDALGTLGEARLVRDWPVLRGDLPRLAYAALGAEVIGRLAADSPTESGLLAQALAFLERLETATAPGSLAIALLIGLLHEAGFAPRLDPALEASCGAEGSLPVALAWDFEDSCFRVAGPLTPRRMLRVPGNAVQALGDVFMQAPPLDGRYAVPATHGPALLRWLIRVWEDHLHAELKAAQFLEKMVLEAKT